MKQLLKKKHLLTIVLTGFLIVLSFHGVTTHASISGDEVCGGVGNECKLSSLKQVAIGILNALVAVGLPLLVVFIIVRFVLAWFALRQGNANAYKEALSKATQAVIGFLIIIALFGGVFLAMLQFFGVRSDGQFNPLKLLQTIFAAAFVTPAYAASLPNPLGVNSLFDFILATLRLVMRFFVYPALIVMWVWSGFQFVYAQGNPTEINKAKSWLLWAFVTTIVVMMIQAFLFAIQGSVNKILPKTSYVEESSIVLKI